MSVDTWYAYVDRAVLPGTMCFGEADFDTPAAGLQFGVGGP